jgi:hypothetical protein
MRENNNKIFLQEIVREGVNWVFCLRIGEVEAVVNNVTKLWISQDVENS